MATSAPARHLPAAGLPQDLRRHEDEQFTFGIEGGVAAEETTNSRDVTEDRNLVFSSRSFLFEDTAEYDCFTIVDPHGRLHAAGIDRRNITQGTRIVRVVLGNLQVHEDLVVRRNGRRHLELQDRLLELDVGGTTRGIFEVGNFKTLLDHSFLLIRGDDSRCRDDLAPALLLHGGQLELQQCATHLADHEPERTTFHATEGRWKVDQQPGGIAISEVGARPPGAQITAMTSLAHDFDLYRAWARLMIHGRFEPPERKYAAWPEAIRQGFEPARTVKTGALKVMLEAAS